MHPRPEGQEESHQARQRRYKRRNRIGIMFGRLKDWPIVGKTVHWTVF